MRAKTKQNLGNKMKMNLRKRVQKRGKKKLVQ